MIPFLAKPISHFTIIPPIIGERILPLFDVIDGNGNILHFLMLLYQLRSITITFVFLCINNNPDLIHCIYIMKNQKDNRRETMKNQKTIFMQINSQQKHH